MAFRARSTIIVFLVIIVLLLGVGISVVVFRLGSPGTSSTNSTAASGNNYTLTQTGSIQLPSVGVRFDHLSDDLAAHLLFVAARGNNSVYVVDLNSDKLVRTIAGFNEPQGVFYVPQFNRLYVSNGGDGTVDVFDVSTFALIKNLTFSSDADNIRYDSTTALLYVAYGAGNQSGIGIINVSSDMVIGSISLNGHPEAFELEKNGTRIFANVPTASSIEIIDRVKRVVIASWPASIALENFPMALDEKNHRLFVGFWLPAELLVYDTDSGKVVASLNISKDADDIFYDHNSNFVLVSCGEGFVDVVRQQNADSYQTRLVIPTAYVARTSLFVPELRELFVAVPQNGNVSAEIMIFSVITSSTQSASA